MTTEEKFRAAVNVIRGLPKKGSFQPSASLQLKFYGYFKQATDGPNTTPKPYMWEVIKKAKWDAWARLGDMSKEDAMNSYLKELNNIVEEMASSGNVEEFLVGMDDFYAQVPANDVDLCIGPTIERIKAKSSTNLPSHLAASSENIRSKVVSNSYEMFDDEDDEYFLDSVDTLVINSDAKINNGTGQMVYVNGHSSPMKGNRVGESTADILMKTVATLHSDINRIEETIKKIEQLQKSVIRGRRQMFGNLSPQTIAFITLWPVLVNLGLVWLYSRRNRAH